MWESLTRLYGITNATDLIVVASKYIFIVAIAGLAWSFCLEWMKSFWANRGVVFIKYYEKQSLILSELFSKMSVLDRNIQTYIFLMIRSHPSIADTTQALEAIYDYKNFFQDNEIFLSEKIITLSNSIINIADKAFGQFSSIVPLPYSNEELLEFDDIEKDFKLNLLTFRQELKIEIENLLRKS